MQTIINNDQRIFLLTGDMGKHVICNIEEFKRAFNSFDDKYEVKIKHLWNQRFVSCSRKSVIDMSVSLGLSNPFKEFYNVTVSFNGRKAGAIGKTYRIRDTFKLSNAQDLTQVHEKYDHVSNLKVISIK